MFKNIALVCLAGLLCLAPTCKTPSASGEISAIFYTDSTVNVKGSISVDSLPNIPEQAEKLVKGEWVEIGGVKFQVLRDSTHATVNIDITAKTK